MPTVRLVLVRHGESQWNEAGILQGHQGPGLTARGRLQAGAVARLLVRDHPDVAGIARSDLPRVVETAAPTEGLLDVPVRVDERLRELDVGAWTGKTRQQVAESDPDRLAAWTRGDDIAAGGGETFGDLRARVTSALADLVQAVADGTGEHPVTVLVFTHGGPIRVAVAAALGLPAGGHRRLESVANAACTILDVPAPRAIVDGGAFLAAYNRVEHLRSGAPG